MGKSTLAAAVADRIGEPYTEIDALFHGPAWTPRPAFLDDVSALIARDGWVTEWQYTAARPMLAHRADLLVWLDLPFLRATLPRVVSRTIRRRLRREELWHGNVEPPFHTFFTNPDHIVRWACKRRHHYRELVPSLESTHPHLTIVRLRSQREVDAWLGGPLAQAAG